MAFVRGERLPSKGSAQYKGAPHVAPDLVAEVASPSQYRPEMAVKARLYHRYGVRLVWIIWPHDQQVEMWRPGANEPVATLGIGELLDEMDVLQGFTYPVSDLFS